MNTEAQILIETQHSKLNTQNYSSFPPSSVFCHPSSALCLPRRSHFGKAGCLPKTPNLPKLLLPTECDFAKQTQFSSSASRQWARSRQRRTSRAQTPRLLPIPRHFPSHHLRQPSHFQSRTVPRSKKLVRGQKCNFAKQTQFWENEKRT